MDIIQLQTATTAEPTYEGSMVRVVTAPIVSALSSHPFALYPGVDNLIHPYPSPSIPIASTARHKCQGARMQIQRYSSLESFERRYSERSDIFHLTGRNLSLYADSSPSANNGGIKGKT